MPILVKDYAWDESVDTVIITVPLKSVHPKKVGLFTTDNYLKVNFPPFFYECFLHEPILHEESSIQIGNGQVVFKLRKQTARLWERLQNEAAENENIKKELRETALQMYREKEEEKKKKKEELNHELKTFGVKEQIRLEQQNREWIEEEKKKERDQADRELQMWKEQHSHQNVVNMNTSLNERHQELGTIPSLEMRPLEKAPSKATIDKANPTKTNKTIFEEPINRAPIRQQAKISVTFTPRVFPTPTRESMLEEEETWLKKQAEARRIIDLEDMNLSEEEKNPLWLRDKGNHFFKEENYEAAINAYTHAIRMNCKMPSLFSNRAACHLKMGNCFKCLEDCTKALELLTPPVEQNRMSRVKVHVRRGTAFVTLKMYAEGLLDYEAALKLDPTNEEIRKDAEKIRAVLEGGGEKEREIEGVRID